MAPKTVIERIGLLACILVGCRAVLGVEDLHVTDDAGPGVDGGADAVSPADAGGDSAPGDTGAGDTAKPTLAACGAWCETDAGLSDAAAAFFADMKACMCQGNVAKACGAECPGLCPSGTPSSPTCEACILQQAFGGGVCAAKAGNCSAACLAYGQCVKSCQ